MNTYQTVMGSAMEKKKAERRKYRVLKGNLHSQIKANGTRAGTGADAKRHKEHEKGIWDRKPRQQGNWWVEGVARLVWLYRVSRESAGNEMKWQEMEGVGPCKSRLAFILLADVISPGSFWLHSENKLPWNKGGSRKAWWWPGLGDSNGGCGVSGFRWTGNHGYRLYNNIRKW